MHFFILALFCNISLFAISPKEAMQKLKEGNLRYVQNTSNCANRDISHREPLLIEQTPFAVIVGCSDARVAPEIIFDQEPGDLFIVRVAGNVLGPIELESIAYAAKYLHPSLIVILGHENCGAVKAVIEDKIKDIPYIAALIKPSVEEVQKSKDKELVKGSIIKNLQNMKNILLQTPMIQKFIQEKNIEIETAYFPLHSGIVKWIENEPTSSRKID
jgi:carbonic anhydrase